MTFWFSLIAIIISILSLIVAIIAVLYTRKQYLSPIRPDVYLSYYHVDPFKNKVNFVLQNRSENIAVILDAKTISKNIKLSQPICRYELTNRETDSYFIYCDYIGSDINNNSYQLKIKYADKEGNKYKATIRIGKGEAYIE